MLYNKINKQNTLDFLGILIDVKFFGGILKFFSKMFGNSKIIPKFADDLTTHTSIKVFIIAAVFLLPAYQNGLGCTFSSGSRCKALLTCAKVRDVQSFFILKHFYPTMHTSVKNERTANNSSRISASGSTKTVPSENSLLKWLFLSNKTDESALSYSTDSDKKQKPLRIGHTTHGDNSPIIGNIIVNTYYM